MNGKRVFLKISESRAHMFEQLVMLSACVCYACVRVYVHMRMYACVRVYVRMRMNASCGWCKLLRAEAMIHVFAQLCNTECGSCDFFLKYQKRRVRCILALKACDAVCVSSLRRGHTGCHSILTLRTSKWKDSSSRTMRTLPPDWISGFSGVAGLDL